MGLFSKFKAGLAKTHSKLVHEIKRIVTRSPRLTADSIEELEAALIAADLGTAMTAQIISAVKKNYETQGGAGLDFLAIAQSEIEKSLVGQASRLSLKEIPGGVCVVSIVGVNGTGKTTTSAKLAHYFQSQNKSVLLAACDTFRAAAIEQLKLWGARLKVDVIAGNYGADAAGAPHEVLLVLDATTGMNALNQAREFHKAVPLTGLIVTKLDGTSKGGMVVAIQKELGLPIKFIGLGEQPDDLQPFDAKQFAQALFEE